SLSFSANTTSPPAISTLSLHDALPIWAIILAAAKSCNRTDMKQPDAFLQTEIHQIGGSLYIDLKKSFSVFFLIGDQRSAMVYFRSEEHTSELQSRENLVCRLLLEKKHK